MFSIGEYGSPFEWIAKTLFPNSDTCIAKDNYGDFYSGRCYSVTAAKKQKLI
jgi:hypothetical protein